MPKIPCARLAGLFALLLLAACTSTPFPPPPEKSAAPVVEPAQCPPPKCPACEVCPICPVCPEAQPMAPAEPAPTLQPAGWRELAGFAQDSLLDVLPALRQSCTKTGEQALWRDFCLSLSVLGGDTGDIELRSLLLRELKPWKVVNADGSEQGLVTGYYEPLIKGSRTRSAAARWPIHGVPDDLVSVELDEVYPDLQKFRLRGRVEDGRLKPYWTRAEIGAQGSRLPAPVLLWAEDPIDLFFLQVQGSGRVQLPGGERVRIGYADQNGHPYVSIGRWLIEQGEMTLADASMSGIKNWAQDNPRRREELLNVNPSYVFFRELKDVAGGPIGALGVPLTDRRSIAVDPRFVPLGAPVFIATTVPGSERPLNRLVSAQDTGGAIKGAVRADFFWGFGAEAGKKAGRMRQQGRLWVLLPRAYAPR